MQWHSRGAATPLAPNSATAMVRAGSTGRSEMAPLTPSTSLPLHQQTTARLWSRLFRRVADPT